MGGTTIDADSEGTELVAISEAPEFLERGFVCFWEKPASAPEPGVHDLPKLYRIKDNPTLRSLIRELKERTFVKRIPLKTIRPSDTSTIKHINCIRGSLPKLDSDHIDDLLSSFRGRLRTRSKKRGEFIVGALLFDGGLLLIHSRIDPALFRGRQGRMYTADLVLHPRNLIRADLLEFAQSETFLYAYEYDRRFAKGHADFWGIRPRDVQWEWTDTIRFYYLVGSPEIELIRPASFDEVETMIQNGEITPSGEVHIGKLEARVVRVDVSRKAMSFSEFYERYILLKERIDDHSRFFDTLVNPFQLPAYFDRENRFDYEEDIDMLYKCGQPNHVEVKEKKHDRYVLCYFTDLYPGVKPLSPLVGLFYRSLFQSSRTDVLHVGEPISLEPTRIGNLRIHNELYIDEHMLVFVNELIDKIRDYSSKKGKAVLQAVVTKALKHCISNQHLPLVFDFLFRDYIANALDGAFAVEGLAAKEAEIEFKSKDAYLNSPKDFVRRNLVPLIRKYTQSSPFSRLCIIYGIEDDGTLAPIANLPSDRVTEIEMHANKLLAGDGVVVETHAIKTKYGFLLLVMFFGKPKH